MKHSNGVVMKLAEELGLTIDYLIGGSDNMILDKALLETMKDIEKLSEDNKKQVYYVIDMALSYHKTKRAFAVAQ